MGLRYNPFTGSFDLTRSPGSYLDGEVATYADLPLDTAAAPLNSAWLVRAGSGLWLLTRKPAGIYIRTATGGTDRDADYTYAGTFPDVFSDANFVVYNDADSTKNVKLDASALTTGTTRTLTVPDASGTLPLLETANTFTANQTLNGTNNVAPNQTAASGSSVMTRDLTFETIALEPNADLVTHSLTTQSGAGAAGVAFQNIGSSASVGTTSSSYASVYWGESFLSHRNFSGTPLSTTQAGDFVIKGVMLRVEANQNWILRVLVGQGAGTRVAPLVGADALASRGWGVEFYYDGSDFVYRPFWHDGSFSTGATGIIPNLTAANWPSRVYAIRVRHTASGTIEFYISDGLGGRLPTTPTFTTNVTWGAATFGGRFWAIEAAAASGAAPTTGARIHCRSAYLKVTP